MFEAYKLPPKSETKNEIVKFLSTVESASPKEINNHIIKVFDISEEDYTALNDYENTTIFAYRMCWIRTEMRKEGLIDSPKKGTWFLVRKKA